MTDSVYAPRRKVATGPERPQFLEAGDVDAVMAALIAVTSELSALRERIDTHEQLAAEGRVPDPDAVEGYRPPEPVAAARATWRSAFIRRVLRTIRQEGLAVREGL